ncbi:MAG: flagellar motor switch protein FliN [Treponema sp.]|jgi:flagellar motor switch protein FliN/FliY|nr:flagellar motor switch protein FliN [Treponema sp.]
MSDAALSQDEIDALLSGANAFETGGAVTGTVVPPGESGEIVKALQNFLSGTVGALSSNISMLTGVASTLTSPELSFTNREELIQQLPDMVTVVKADFTSGFPGEHVFVLGEDTAKALASVMNKEENISLDEMAMSVIGEVVSQLVGTEITALTNKTGNKSVASVSPEAANVPKAVAALPGGSFVSALYSLDLSDGKKYKVWEVYGAGVSSDIAKALSGGGAPVAAPRSPSPPPDMSGMMSANMGMGAMPNMGMQGMGQPTNVQSVQFPNLVPRPTPQEQGNIGLIMDVYMEMTVELGRTRKLIKEILGMGEGTIIELDKLAGEPVDILVNHKLIAKGEVVVIDENFGVRVTEIVSPMERMSDMG